MKVNKLSIAGILCLFLVITSSFGCKKTIENVQDDLLVNLIVNGRWVVTQFQVGTENHLTDYAPFQFQFNKNNTVNAIATGSADVVGTWSASTESMTITSAFAGSLPPLSRFNGIWLIKKTTLTTVEANRFEGSVEFKLGLRKL